MKKQVLTFLMITSVIILSSCNSDDNNSSSNYPLTVKMTDAPAAYDEVNIDLQAVEVIGDSGNSFMIDTNAGIYNLLDYSNGLNTAIATSTMNEANVNQIRLILGTNNTIVIDGISYPLSTPSAEQSGLKININKTLTADYQNEILIDFDANQSIVETGNNTFKLKPVLRTINNETTGKISGNIALLGVLATVTATSSTGVEYSSNVNNMGEFQICGLIPGVYTVNLITNFPEVTYTETNVVVQAGTTTNIGTMTSN